MFTGTGGLPIGLSVRTTLNQMRRTLHLNAAFFFVQNIIVKCGAI
jgi:hypothetical protein